MNAVNKGACQCHHRLSEVGRRSVCRVQPRLAEDGDLNPIASWASKLPGKLARIAAALTLYDHPQAVEVNDAYMANAISMAPYFIAHARFCLDLMGANRESRLTPARDVLDWLRKRPNLAEPFTVRDAHRALLGRTWVAEGGSEAVRAAADHLEDLGWIALIPPSDTAGRPGRKPPPKYEVHPLIASGSPR
ncbi:DUF3987 domain-containing protein [Streptomyces sp. 8N616]|uniref:DUF3987 domain-containing protein n=1 Tax=Streptomyces sp. 8N616 TaxID=3457414 RepID=UPI003FD1152C